MKNKNRIFVILIISVIFILTGCESKIVKTIVAPYKYKSILENTYTETALIEEYTRYGKWFNLRGNIVENENKPFSELSLVFKSKTKEIKFPLIVEKRYVEVIEEKEEVIETEENVEESEIVSEELVEEQEVIEESKSEPIINRYTLTTFKTNKYINEGIDFSDKDFDNEDYIILLKNETKYTDGDYEKTRVEYYNLENNTVYTDLSYYGFINNNKERDVLVSFDSWNDYKFTLFSVSENNPKEGIYDIVLDPGHGGSDPGAVFNGHKEIDENLEYAKIVKNKLEAAGYRVILTRETNDEIESYGAGSRTGIPYEVQAKIMLSLHLNAAGGYIASPGLEIYRDYKDSDTFPQIIATSIKKHSGAPSSANTVLRSSGDVYLKTWDQKTISEATKEFAKKGITFYEKANTNTTYYYFIRETGGIITTALADGRNTDQPKNLYYDANFGVEAYLIESAYIDKINSLNHFLNNREKYADGLVEAMNIYSGLNQEPETNNDVETTN